jgi:hypothetical protein
MRLLRKLLAVTAVMTAAFCSVQANALAAPAAHAAQGRASAAGVTPGVMPLTDSRCNYGSGNTTQVCIEIVGGGLYVDDMSIELDVISGQSGTTYRGVIEGPGGFYRATSSEVINSFQAKTTVFTVDAYVSAGTYTAYMEEWLPAPYDIWVTICETSAPVES